MENEREVRLRRRIEELVRARVGLLEQDISRVQREVNESFTRLLESTDVAASVPEDDDAVAQIAAEVHAQIDQAGAESVRLGADIALLRDSVAELNEQRTQADVLNALVARAANFVPRVVLFVVKGGNAVAWAGRGLDEGLGPIRGMSVSLEADNVLRPALNSQQTFYGSPELQSENQSIFTRLGNIHPERVLAVPLKVRGKTAALVYADSAERGEVAINVEAIELLAQTAGLVVELVSLRARMSEAAQPARQPAAEPVASSSGNLRSGELRPPSRPSAELSTRPEHVPEPQPEPAYYRPTAEPAAPTPSSSFASPSSHAVDDEEKAHNDARRFARLLVSEIKLYNEHKVAEGRRSGDLYDRLKEDIDRSRQMYEKRVTPGVAAKFDYFYDELVGTLAEGDSGKLGSDCPGPTVAATI
ncbi:MAG TPA: hypothetical protein VLM38_05805 [Blastocatellia bacterium]|nr:hypothetical protein [Blastocatellia bacterium]